MAKTTASVLADCYSENDYHVEGVPDDEISSRHKTISHRWKQFHSLQIKYEDMAIKYLFATNAGGAIATLGFIGSSSLARETPSVVLALISFGAGLLFCGILKLLVLLRIGYVFWRYQKDVSLYYSGKLAFPALEKNDRRRTNNNIPEYITGGISFICFSWGLFCGAKALFALI